ncbi:T9SS type A sorting domain-containing protein [uncultured Psychroserpens sp.]|uniref:T9SS type A sorting domain-containing protein n=1 Tax=uncultured Psychroserpens sp. TaxID=255436 RepID=UPI00261DFDC5|nr:T9SS type A sorting domain-containing protein [uncultured Psychroserpens sp.]
MKTITNFQISKTTRVSALLFCIALMCSNFVFANTPNDPDLRKKIGLQLNSAGTYEREILVVEDENATEGYDADYDTAIDNIQSDDMYWVIDQGKYINQAIGEINEETVIALGIHTNTSGINTISINKLENIPNAMKIFVHDTQTGVYHSIKDGAYEINLPAGLYLNRFEIVFMQPETLSTTDFDADKSLDIMFDTSADQIKILNNANLKIDTVEVYSILGQSVHRSNASNSNNELSINTNTMTTGAYVVIVKAENGINSKKILVN